MKNKIKCILCPWLVMLPAFIFTSCRTQETALFMNRSMCGSQEVYYADKYDGLHFRKYFQDGRQFSNGLAAVKEDGKWGFITAEGKIQIPSEYDWVSSFGEFGFDESVAVVKNKTDKDKIPMFTACPSWLINKKGKKITPQYGIIFPIENKLSIVNNGTEFRPVGKSFASSDGKWGAVNSRGEVVIDCEYDLMYPFWEDITFVQKKGKWGCVNEKGKLLIPCKYDRVCFKSERAEVDSRFDAAATDDLKHTLIPNQKLNVIYMFSENEVIPFSKKGKRISDKQ